MTLESEAEETLEWVIQELERRITLSEKEGNYTGYITVCTGIDKPHPLSIAKRIFKAFDSLLMAYRIDTYGTGPGTSDIEKVLSYNFVHKDIVATEYVGV